MTQARCLIHDVLPAGTWYSNIFSKTMAPLILLSLLLIAPLGAYADLRQGLIGSRIEALFPGDSQYTESRQAFNQRFNVHPAAIVFPTSAQDVSQIVKIGAANKLRVVARSGGHSYAANGLGGQDGALVIDLKKMNKITIDTNTNIAHVEAGNKLGSVAAALNAVGRALPHGSCTYVGVGGHASFGGFGFTSRMWGLMTDTIRAANVVFANGTLSRVSESSHPDIFWAVRGAAPSIVIVTSFEFETFPEPNYAVIWGYGWDLSASDAASALKIFQNFSLTSDLPSHLTTDVNLGQGSQRGFVSFRVSGGWYSSSSDQAENEKALNASLAPLLESLPPPTGVSREGNGTYIDTVIILANSDKGLDTSTPEGNDTFYAKSLMTPEAEPMNDETCLSFMTYLAEDGYDSGLGWFFQIGVYGGRNSKINALPANATSFVRRDTLFTMQFYASSPGNIPPYPNEGFTFLDGVVNSITSGMPEAWDYSAYTNYLDNRLEDWPKLYFGSHYARLQRIKQEVDPRNVFKFPTSINS
ncbi:hypothetical protein E1B28_000019 [Marasmius oreades]|nr:uncharacterized protein E1B28_000019 [Marasmius oreades]KAG7098044.1 hypothetical protein E1B28_000019 [Marasmius oreades]